MRIKLIIYLLLAGILLAPLAEQAAARPLAEVSSTFYPIKPLKQRKKKKLKRSRKRSKPQKKQINTLFIGIILITLFLLASWIFFAIGVQLMISWLWHLGLIIAMAGAGFLLLFYLIIYMDITPPSENNGFGGAILALTLLVMLFTSGIAGLTLLIWGLIVMNSLLWIVGSIALFLVILPIILLMIHNTMN